MVVDATPGERLKRVVEKTAKKYGIKMKVIERRGRTMKTMFQKSNPFGVVGCSERDCVVCKGGMGVDCRKRGVVYEIGCEEEGCGKKYIGQTGRTLYERLMPLSRTIAEHSPTIRQKFLATPEGAFNGNSGKF